jgi:predicted dehydrogenase
MAVAPHARSLVDLEDGGIVEVVAAWSPSAERRSQFAQRYRFPIRDSFEAIIQDSSVDGAILVTPPNARRELIEALAGAGKHVLSEKPLERTTVAAQHLVDVCAHSGVKLAVMFQHRFRPFAVKLRELLAEGSLGDPAVIQLTVPWWRPQSYYDEPGRGTLWRDGGGVLINQAIHSLDVMLDLFGPVEHVSAVVGTSSLHHMESEDTVSAGLRFANGAIGSVFASTACFPGTGEQIHACCTRATATVQAGSLRVDWRDGRSELFAGESQSGSGSDPMAFPHDAHRAVIQDFVDAVRQQREPIISGKSAMRVHHLIDATLASALSREG